VAPNNIKKKILKIRDPNATAVSWVFDTQIYV
jgi:hypothetical protein